MGVNPEIVGRVYPPSPVYEVGREKIREFAEAIGSRDPCTPDPEAARALGYPDVIAPPTFAVIVAPAQRGPAASPTRTPGIDFSRVVHGEQRFTHHRPIVAGDRLVATLHVDAVRAAGGHAMVTTRVEIADEDGDPVSTVVSTIVVRGEGQVTRVRPSTPWPSATSCRRSTTRCDRADLVRYAGASGDFNPIHWNERFARRGRPARRDRPRHAHDGDGGPAGHRLVR